jgi:EPS-associated MarR family transcriptional regulator
MKRQEELEILRVINKKRKSSQRELAKNLGFSLGKLNYCLNALKQKGFLKIKNFKNNEKKIRYLYLLTPLGMSKKTQLTISFMKRKMEEYDELKNEISKSNEDKFN